MSGMVDRRNQREFWAGKVTWTRLKRKVQPVCEDCLLNVHAAGGTTGRIPRATWKRTVGRHDVPANATNLFVLLCDTHKQDWVDWTPGQTIMPMGEQS